MRWTQVVQGLNSSSYISFSYGHVKQAYNIAYEVIQMVGIASSCRPTAHGSISVSCWSLWGIHMLWEQLEKPQQRHLLYESASAFTSL